VARVGLNDDLFALGATSMDVIRIHQKVRTVLNRDVEITEMFKHHTLGSLAERLDKEQQKSDLEASYRRASARLASRRRPGNG
jgi:hypothetical protein